MERYYHPEFDPYALKSTPTTGTKNRELETVGSITPSTPILGHVEVAKKAKTDRSSGEWKMKVAIWEHYSFTMISDVKGEYKANCKYCHNTHYKVTSRYGTSNAKRHIDNCAAHKPFLAQNPGHVTDFDQRVFIRMFAKAIMYQTCPLFMVENVKLREMLSYLNPKVRHVTMNTILTYFWLEH
ncbi:Zinc finger BED domain-containing protein RICESLEEPER 4 [Bienertia sinuspersici]